MIFSNQLNLITVCHSQTRTIMSLNWCNLFPCYL